MKNKLIMLIGLIGIILTGMIFYLASLKMTPKKDINEKTKNDIIELDKEQEYLKQIKDYKPIKRNYKSNENEK